MMSDAERAPSGAPDDPVVDPSVDDLLAVIGHELRTPLVVARGYTELLGDSSGRPPEGLDEIRDTIARNIDFALLLLERLRQTRRLETDELDLDPEPLELVAFVDHIVEEMRVSVLGEHPTELHLPDDGVPVEADPAALRQALFNLLTNAVRYSPSTAPVVIRVESDGATGRVVVRNHGIGVAPDQVDKLFRKFAYSSDHHPGLGLGLYLARGIARAHGGDVTAEPAEDVGSRFILTLPVSRSRSARLDPAR